MRFPMDSIEMRGTKSPTCSPPRSALAERGRSRAEGSPRRLSHRQQLPTESTEKREEAGSGIFTQRLKGAGGGERTEGTEPELPTENTESTEKGGQKRDECRIRGPMGIGPLRIRPVHPAPLCGCASASGGLRENSSVLRPPSFSLSARHLGLPSVTSVGNLSSGA